ncbi:MAG TPA: ABC transporter substrate-binding protein [Polyangiaceae bacterium]|nr:ABC transporter substrate-binding protein [Polyangiaceae bacterium]
MNRRALVASLGALLFSAGAAVGISRLAAKKPGKSGNGRLISLAPAITETVITLNALDQLVAVSNYCVLPPGAKLPRIGSSLTPSFEAIATLHPSLILCDDSAGSKQKELSALARTEIFPWLTLDEVTESTRRLGKVLGQELAADALAQQLEMRLSRKSPPDAPRALLLLSYDPDRPAELWFIRPNSLHGAALASAGVRNVINRDVKGLPQLSVEQLIQLDPDMVLIIPTPGATPENKRKMLDAFRALAPLKAVKDDRLGVVDGTQAVGPSILQFADSLRALVQRLSGPHPVGGIIQ